MGDQLNWEPIEWGTVIEFGDRYWMKEPLLNGEPVERESHESWRNKQLFSKDEKQIFCRISGGKTNSGVASLISGSIFTLWMVWYFWHRRNPRRWKQTCRKRIGNRWKSPVSIWRRKDNFGRKKKGRRQKGKDYHHTNSCLQKRPEKKASGGFLAAVIVGLELAAYFCFLPCGVNNLACPGECLAVYKVHKYWPAARQKADMNTQSAMHNEYWRKEKVSWQVCVMFSQTIT